MAKVALAMGYSSVSFGSWGSGGTDRNEPHPKNATRPPVTPFFLYLPLSLLQFLFISYFTSLHTFPLSWFPSYPTVSLSCAGTSFTDILGLSVSLLSCSCFPCFLVLLSQFLHCFFFSIPLPSLSNRYSFLTTFTKSHIRFPDT